MLGGGAGAHGVTVSWKTRGRLSTRNGEEMSGERECGRVVLEPGRGEMLGVLLCTFQFVTPKL